MMSNTAPLMLCDRVRTTCPNIRSTMLPSGLLGIDFQVYQVQVRNSTALVGKGLATIQKLTKERDEANNQVLELDERLAQMTKERDEALALLAKKTKTKAPKKPKKAPAPKAVPKYISGAGANAKAQRRLQGAGKLEPFREGGCRCRTFGNGLGTQCHAKAKIDGMCATHHKKTEANNGLWTCGFYDTPRPSKWGEEQMGGICLPVPGDRKAGATIPWKMDDETYATAFANRNQLDTQGQVVLDIQRNNIDHHVRVVMAEEEEQTGGASGPQVAPVLPPAPVEEEVVVVWSAPEEDDVEISDDESEASTLELEDETASSDGSNADFGY